MTREEAINHLIAIKYNFSWSDYLKKKEALGMAIESLEKDGRETNLEHYFYEWAYKDGKVVITFEEDMTNEFLNKDESCKIVRWLLKPYEEPPKYKVSQFEYDLLKCFLSSSEFGIEDFCSLDEMQDKGYFKDIPSDVPIKDILDNCEVIEERDDNG